jgi:hypothetical protein
LREELLPVHHELEASCESITWASDFETLEVRSNLSVSKQKSRT